MFIKTALPTNSTLYQLALHLSTLPIKIMAVPSRANLFADMASRSFELCLSDPPSNYARFNLTELQRGFILTGEDLRRYLWNNTSHYIQCHPRKMSLAQKGMNMEDLRIVFQNLPEIAYMKLAAEKFETLTNDALVWENILNKKNVTKSDLQKLRSKYRLDELKVKADAFMTDIKTNGYLTALFHEPAVHFVKQFMMFLRNTKHKVNFFKSLYYFEFIPLESRVNTLRKIEDFLKQKYNIIFSCLSEFIDIVYFMILQDSMIIIERDDIARSSVKNRLDYKRGVVVPH